MMMNLNIPEVLKQKLEEVEGSAKIISTQASSSEGNGQPKPNLNTGSIENGRFLLWKGIETGLFYVVGNPTPGSLLVYDYRHGTEHAQPCLSHHFGRAALVSDVLFFPLAVDHPGIIVAVADRSMDKHGDYLAYFSLRSRRLLNAFYLPYPITSLCAILDGSADRSQFAKLASTFHNDWPHILLVGCRFGYVTLVHLDLSPDADHVHSSPVFVPTSSNSPSTVTTRKPEPPAIQPVRCRKNVHLSKIFYEDEMFVFRADDGTTKCQSKDKVSVSALYWLEKSGLAMIGFNFGGIMVVSLRTSKVFSMFYMDGMVQHFAVQEPEEDPRPVLFCWIAYNCYSRGHSLVLCNISFPKDEERAKQTSDGGGAAEHTYTDPFFAPSMKWPLDNCSRLITMRTICQPKRTSANNSDCADLSQMLAVFDQSDGLSSTSEWAQNVLRQSTSVDTSLLFVAWMEMRRFGEMKIHGALFDLNAFYAKRLVPRILPDSTVARQIPFIARFSSSSSTDLASAHKLLDIVPSRVHRFTPPAFLNESIDQLYYPSTYYIYNNSLSSTRIFQNKVLPIQVQLISELSDNIAIHFENPHEPARWIHAIGLSNSAPSPNINEERVCLLRLVTHSFFPGTLSLIESAADSPDLLRFIHKWIWKDLEITKTKFDDLCSPLFANPPHDLSPSARGYIHHARVFFKRASIVFEHLHAKVAKLDDPQWSQSIVVQGQTARQVRLYSASIAFALDNNFLPLDALNSRLFTVVSEQFAKRAEMAKQRRKPLQIHKLVGEIIDLNRDEDELWQGRIADWYPPRGFSNFLPILLLVNITEAAKMTLLAYYCLDLEAAAANFGSNVEAKDGSTPPSSSLRSHLVKADNTFNSSFRNLKFFSLFFSFLCQEDLSLEEMNRVRALWMEDKRLSEVDPDAEKLLVLSNGPSSDEQTKTIERLKSLPLGSAAEIRKLQAEFLRLDWGLFRYNELMLDRRHFTLLLDVPPLQGNEPEFVQHCHARCLDIKRRFPALFKKVKPLPGFIMERFRQKTMQQRKVPFHMQYTGPFTQDQPVLPLNIKHGAAPTSIAPFPQQNIFPTTHRYGKRAVGSLSVGTPILDGEDSAELYEELPLTIATPKRKQRAMPFEGAESSGLILQMEEDVGMEEQVVIGEEQEHPKTPEEATSAGRRTPNGMEKSPVACNIIQKGSVKARDWERIVRLTQTPLSLRKSLSASKMPIRLTMTRPSDHARTVLFPAKENGERGRPSSDEQDEGGAGEQPEKQKEDEAQKQREEPNEQEQVSPVPNMSRPEPQPTSILKSDKRPSRLPPDSLSCRPRLRFAQALFTTEQIPSRAERAMDERKDSSFTNFSCLSPSESSASSALVASPAPVMSDSKSASSQSQSLSPSSTRKRGHPEEELTEEEGPRTPPPTTQSMEETPQPPQSPPPTRKRGRPSIGATTTRSSPPKAAIISDNDNAIAHHTRSKTPENAQAEQGDDGIAHHTRSKTPEKIHKEAATTTTGNTITYHTRSKTPEKMQTETDPATQKAIAHHTRSKTPEKTQPDVVPTIIAKEDMAMTTQKAIAHHTRSKTPEKKQPEAVSVTKTTGMLTRAKSKTPEKERQQPQQAVPEPEDPPSPPTTRRSGRLAESVATASPKARSTVAAQQPITATPSPKRRRGRPSKASGSNSQPQDK